MKCEFKKEKLNPMKLMKRWWPTADVSHIEYDPDMKGGDYNIVKQSGGDGTLLFTIQMLQEALLRILNMQSYFKLKPPNNWNQVKAIRYKIGPMRHVTVFGRIHLKCSKTVLYPGQVERVKIPVISKFIYKKERKQDNA